jgi:hypothetical protein
MSLFPWRIVSNSRTKFVISTGGVMGLRPIQGNEERLGSVHNFDETTTLSFVIPSEAEGSAVPRTLPGNAFDRA